MDCRLTWMQAACCATRAPPSRPPLHPHLVDGVSVGAVHLNLVLRQGSPSVAGVSSMQRGHTLSPACPSMPHSNLKAPLRSQQGVPAAVGRPGGTGKASHSAPQRSTHHHGELKAKLAERPLALLLGGAWCLATKLVAGELQDGRGRRGSLDTAQQHSDGVSAAPHVASGAWARRRTAPMQQAHALRLPGAAVLATTHGDQVETLISVLVVQRPQTRIVDILEGSFARDVDHHQHLHAASWKAGGKGGGGAAARQPHTRTSTLVLPEAVPTAGHAAGPTPRLACPLNCENETSFSYCRACARAHTPATWCRAGPDPTRGGRLCCCDTRLAGRAGAGWTGFPRAQLVHPPTGHRWRPQLVPRPPHQPLAGPERRWWPAASRAGRVQYRGGPRTPCRTLRPACRPLAGRPLAWLVSMAEEGWPGPVRGRDPACRPAWQPQPCGKAQSGLLACEVTCLLRWAPAALCPRAAAALAHFVGQTLPPAWSGTRPRALRCQPLQCMTP